MAKRTKMERISEESSLAIHELKERYECKSAGEILDALIFHATDLKQLEDFLSGKKKR